MRPRYLPCPGKSFSNFVPTRPRRLRSKSRGATCRVIAWTAALGVVAASFLPPAAGLRALDDRRGEDADEDEDDDDDEDVVLPLLVLVDDG